MTKNKVAIFFKKHNTIVESTVVQWQVVFTLNRLKLRASEGWGEGREVAIKGKKGSAYTDYCFMQYSFITIITDALILSLFKI